MADKVDKREAWRAILDKRGPVVPRDQRAAIAYAVEIQAQIDAHTAALTKLSQQRPDAIRAVLDSGAMNQSELAELLGLSRSRVSHILRS